MVDSTTPCPIPAYLLRRRVYLLHFYDPETHASAKLHHAAHYCGMSEDVSARLAEHGTSRGARLTYAARQKAGLSWVVARVWIGGRTLERKLKRRHSGVRLCPICRGEITLEQVLAEQAPPTARTPGRRVPMQASTRYFP
jgi:hypothetical protein